MYFSMSRVYWNRTWLWKISGRILRRSIMKSQWRLDIILISRQTIFSIQKMYITIYTFQTLFSFWLPSCYSTAHWVYITHIFSKFKCHIQLFISRQQNIKACRVLKKEKTVWERKTQITATDVPQRQHSNAFHPSVFLGMSQNVTIYTVKMKWWGPYW